MNKNPFENNPDIPSIVYKYRDWTNCYHRNMIEKQELYLTSPRWFNDPYDCRINVAFHLLAEDANLANEYFHQVVSRHFPDLSEADHNLQVQRLLDEGRFRNKEWLEEENERTINKLHDTIGVISLTAHNDSILMWSHYSNSHKGFCVGFHSSKLFNHPEHFGWGQAVEYPPKYPVILPTESFTEQSRKQMFMKFDKWEYEKEYRLLNYNCADKVVKIPKDNFAEIILGHLISKEDQRHIIKTVKNNLPDIKILKVKANPQDYKLAIEPFNEK